MEVKRSGVLFASVLVLAHTSCTDGEGRAPDARAPTAVATGLASAAEAPPAPRDPCADFGPPTCLAPDTTLRCVAGQPTAEPCDGSELCLEGSCVTPDPQWPVATRLRAVREPGFLSAWTVASGLPSKAARKLFEGDDVALAASRTSRVCSADNDGRWVGLGKRSDSAAAVLSATVLLGKPRSLQLRASARGRLTLRVAGKEFVAEELPGRSGRPLPDERFFDVELPAGPSEVRALLEPESGGFYLRFAERTGRPATGLMVAERLEKGSCGPQDLVVLSGAPIAKAGKLQLDHRLEFASLVPAAPELTLRVSLGKKPADVVQQQLTRQQLILGSSLSQSLAPPERGGFVLGVTLADRVLEARSFPAASAIYKLAQEAEQLLSESQVAALSESTRTSLREQYRTLSRSLASGERDLGWLRRRFDKLLSLLRVARTGVDPFAAERKIVHRAYVSPLDGQPRPYVAHIPPSYDKRESVALVLVMHGRDRLPEHALRTLVGQAPDEHMTLRFAERNLPAMPDFGTILAAPSGFGDAGVLGVGEREVLDVIDDLIRAYPKIDPRRVSITGYSLGGTVSFALPLHFPDRFAAAAPLCGYPNLLGYNSVSKVAHAPHEAALLSQEYLANYAENGLHVPLFIVHGGKDVPGRSKVVADRYKELKQSHVFDVPDDLDHNVWDYAYEDGKMIPWLAKKSVPAAPNQARLVTGKLRYHRAHWITLGKMLDSQKRSLIDARLDTASQKLHITTENTAAMELDLPRLVVGGGTISVEVDGRSISADASKSLFLNKQGDGFVLATQLPTSGKVPGASGPIDDYQFGPTVIVVGTLDPELTDAHRLVAEQLRDVFGSSDVRFPVVDDTKADEASTAGRNLLLLGGPAHNVITKRLAASLPIQVAPDAITLRDQRFAGPDVATMFISPLPGTQENPIADRRYAVVVAGLSARAVLAARMLPRYLPDYVVFDSRLGVRRGGLLLEDRPIAAAGFFDQEFR